MRRIVVRAPACGADIVTFLKHALRTHAEELQPGERAAFVFDAERFSFPIEIFKALLAGVGLQLCLTREEDGTHVLEVEKRQRENV